MSNYCVCCGIEIPDGQNTCSMCYGDPYHGSDGYYLRWLEDKELEEQNQNQTEEDLGEENE